MMVWLLFIIVLMGLFCVHSKSSIISTVVLPTTEIIEPYNKGARRGQLKKHLAGASLLPAELVN